MQWLPIIIFMCQWTRETCTIKMQECEHCNNGKYTFSIMKNINPCKFDINNVGEKKCIFFYVFHWKTVSFNSRAIGPLSYTTKAICDIWDKFSFHLQISVKGRLPQSHSSETLQDLKTWLGGRGELFKNLWISNIFLSRGKHKSNKCLI